MQIKTHKRNNNKQTIITRENGDKEEQNTIISQRLYASEIVLVLASVAVTTSYIFSTQVQEGF